jgi:predicted acetyltransferase
MSSLRLRPLRAGDECEARAAHAELAGDDFSFLLDWDPDEPWADYLARRDLLARGLEVPDDRVPSTFLLALVGEDLVGRISIRHELNEFLAAFGGHIGYCVRPTFRRRGHATEILRQGLIIARSLGIGAVLVVCDPENPGSIGAIERLGGVLEDVRVDDDGTLHRRYWIA